MSEREQPTRRNSVGQGSLPKLQCLTDVADHPQPAATEALLCGFEEDRVDAGEERRERVDMTERKVGMQSPFLH